MFELDPCNLRDGEAEVVAARIVAALAAATDAPDETFGARRQRLVQRLLAWPD